MDLVVVGGGISGLTAAWTLTRERPDATVRLLEAGARVGGMVSTERWEGCVVEHGPEGFVSSRPEAIDLVDALGLRDELVVDGPAPRQTFVARGDGLLPLPYGILNPDRQSATALLRSPLLSHRGRARLLLEPLVGRRRDTADESVAAFVRRRFGHELLDALVEPLVGGIHGSSTDELSAQMLLPQLCRLEREGHSVGLAAIRRRRGGTASATGTDLPPLVTLRDGMGSLTDALADALGDRIRRDAPVVALEHAGPPPSADHAATGAEESAGTGRWQLRLGDGTSVTAHGVVLATPAAVTARLLEPLDPVLADLLRELRWGTSTTVTLIWGPGAAPTPTGGTGYLVPRSEGGRIAACTWVTSKWHHRSTGGRVMMRLFVRDGADLDDRALVDVARAEVRVRTGITPTPARSIVWRVDDALPVVQVGHRVRTEGIHARAGALPSLVLAGAGLEGAGLPACIRSGQRAARDLVAAR